MNTKIRKFLASLAGLSFVLLTSNSFASAVGTANISIDWDTLSVSTSGGLTLTPDPLGGGRYVYSGGLGVSQAWFRSENTTGLPYSSTYSATPPVFSPINYSLSDGSGSNSANLVNDSGTGSLLAVASDSDGDITKSNLISAYVNRGIRYIVSGTGSLHVGFDYSMLLTTSGIAPGDYANVIGRVVLGIQEYDNQTYDYLGNYVDESSKQIDSYLNEYLFSLDDAVSLDLNFSNVTNHLLLFEFNAIGIAYANSAVAGTSLPEPGSIVLIAIGLVVLSFSRRKWI